jgi:hypothetical protein
VITRKATDGKTRLRPEWQDINDRFTPQELAEVHLDPDIRRYAYPHMLRIHDSGAGDWEWEVIYESGSWPEPRVASGRARTPMEAQRKADAAHDRLVAKYGAVK